MSQKSVFIKIGGTGWSWPVSSSLLTPDLDGGAILEHGGGFTTGLTPLPDTCSHTLIGPGAPWFHHPVRPRPYREAVLGGANINILSTTWNIQKEMKPWTKYRSDLLLQTSLKGFWWMTLMVKTKQKTPCFLSQSRWFRVCSGHSGVTPVWEERNGLLPREGADPEPSDPLFVINFVLLGSNGSMKRLTALGSALSVTQQGEGWASMCVWWCLGVCHGNLYSRNLSFFFQTHPTSPTPGRHVRNMGKKVANSCLVKTSIFPKRNTPFSSKTQPSSI